VIRWAWASLVANIAIVLTGGLVRLTDSGLGCPTWPRCTDESFVPHRALGIHGAIEFGNRMFTYVLIAVAIGTLVAVWRSAGHRAERPLAIALAAGIPLQGVVGGLTVLTDLNPWLVSLHLVLSMALIAGSVILLARVSGWSKASVGSSSRALVGAMFVVVVVVVYVGTIVTGSGPHAGDITAARNGLDPLTLSHVHAYAAYALLAVTLACVVVLRRTLAARAAGALLIVEAAQAAIGVAQYNLGLPIWLVGAHLVGAAVLMAAATSLLVRVRATT
jgi:cytochrome c oxidase assembly protein subunit 15